MLEVAEQCCVKLTGNLTRLSEGRGGFCANSVQKSREFAFFLEKLAHPSGVEPDGSASKHKEIQDDAHKNAHKDSDLEEIIAAWPSLSCPLKAAVLALVRTATGEGAGHGHS